MCITLLAVGDRGGGFGQEKQRDDLPGICRHPERLVGAKVVQKRGWVRDAEDNGDLVRNGYWILDDVSAVGIVEKVHGDGKCDVEFRDDTGWQRVDLQVKEVRKTLIYYDRYGDKLDVESWTEEGMMVHPHDHGLIVDQKGSWRKVRFPLNCLALAPLQKGDKVVRGPDWNYGFDDGITPDAETIPDPNLFGVVTDTSDEDNYVKVKWDNTGIERRCRYDCRRRYDVVPYELIFREEQKERR
jgi:hypothetical protein